MNIHPLFVHFPIGLLAVYSLLEIGAYVLPVLRRQTWVFAVKAFLLFVGVLAAFVALATGGLAEKFVENGPAAFVLEVHAPFAATTTILYLILASAYLIRIFDTEGWGKAIAGLSNPFIRIWSIKKYIAHIVLDTWLLPVVALLALVSLTITGALGAIIVYGPNIDPFVSFIFHLFWPA